VVLINLFLAFLRVGLFAIGGAYSFLPLIEKEVVQRYQWLTREEFLDVQGMTQVLPGAISIKYATYTGYKMGGFFGVLLANLGNILAPTLLVIFASVFYTKYKNAPGFKGGFEAVRFCVFAMIIAVAFQTLDTRNLIQFRSILIVVLSFTLFSFTKVHPAIIIILAGILGGIWK
jgi:chromate transporter